jgi:hypothetical protein
MGFLSLPAFGPQRSRMTASVVKGRNNGVWPMGSTRGGRRVDQITEGRKPQGFVTKGRQ